MRLLTLLGLVVVIDGAACGPRCGPDVHGVCTATAHALTPAAAARSPVPLPRLPFADPDPEALRVIRAFGDGAWRFSGPTVFGTSSDGGATLPAWNDHELYLNDARTGLPRVVLPLGPSQRVWETRVVAATFDRSGARAAALLQNRSVLFWASFDAAPALFHAPAITWYQRQSPGSVVDVRGTLFDIWRGTRSEYSPAWAIERAEHRLAFSEDGARLVAGEQVFAIPEGDLLLGPAADEVVLDVGDRGAIVARFAIDRWIGTPGAQCGFTPGQDVARLTAVELRPLEGPPIVYPGPKDVGLQAASVTGHRVQVIDRAFRVTVRDLATAAPLEIAKQPLAPASATPSFRPQHGIGSIDVADDGTIAFVQDGRGWIAGTATMQPLERPTAGGAELVRIVLGAAGAFAVVDEGASRGYGAHQAVYAFDAGGGARAVIHGGMVGRVSPSGHTVVEDADDFALWSASDSRRLRRIRDRPQGLYATDQARVVGGGRRVVMADSTLDERRFIIRDGDAAPRTVAVRDGGQRREYSWELADDGSALAVVLDRAVEVRSLDGGAVLLRAPRSELPLRALGVSRHVTAIGEDDGAVRVWRDGRARRLDLRPLHDIATALAISPDERLLAIGTARGLVVLAALEPGGPSTAASVQPARPASEGRVRRQRRRPPMSVRVATTPRTSSRA